MKNFLSYSLVLFIGVFFFSSSIKQSNLLKSTHQLIKPKKELFKDTSINKLPEGYKFISNFKLKKNKKTIAISQDNYGIMLFLNSKSVIFFDGKTEKELYIDNIPNTLKKDKNLNQFYIACKEGFGLLKKLENGEYTYKSISDINTIDNFTKLLVSENKVWFISKHKIVSINPKNVNDNKIEYFNRKKNITGAFIFKDKLYFSQYNKGLFVLEKDTSKIVISDSLFKKAEIIFSVTNKKKVILGLSNNKIYSFNGKSYSLVKTSSEEYITESIISGGLNYNEDKFVVLTLNGGAIVINKKTGKTTNTINYRTGLPDDEIFCAKTLKNGSLWLSHDYGISRVAFDIPVSSYEYPGLQGKINTFKVFDSTLYVATGEGLFKLAEIQSFEEVEVATKKKVKSRIKSRLKNNSTSPSKKYTEKDNYITEDDIEADKEEQGGFFSRWKKRKSKKKKEEQEQELNKENNNNNKKDVTQKKKTQKWTYKTVYKDVVEYQKIYELQSIKYSYKQIEGINSKCKQLVVFSNGLLIASNSGLYYIKNNEVKNIIKNIYVYNISENTNDKSVYIATSSGIFKIINTNKGIFAKKFISETFKNIKLKNVFKENDTTIWCNTFNIIYKFKINKSKVVTSQKYIINNEQIENLKIITEKDTVLFFTSNNVFYYNYKEDKVLPKKDYNYFYRNSDNLFSITDTSLVLISNKSITLSINTNENLSHLKYAWLFNNIEKIYTDDDNNIWVLTADNYIYKISEVTNNDKENFKIAIKQINDNSGNSYNNSENLQLKSNYNSLIVELSSPYYIKKDFIKYSYAIDDNSAERFIEYSGSKIEIPELKIGNHTIYFQAINDLNEKSEILSIKVTIEPPFWQTTAFIVISFFILLILLSVIISSFYRRKERKIKEYNQLLEAKVKERTSEIQEQNRLIQNQNQEIYSQYEKINHQNEEITGSIRYAGRIQKAALPNTDIQKKYISGYFNLFKPRDIVSGDFYWMSEAQNKLFIAAVDCTGHGVPGGFLSMLGISFLNEIVRELNKETEEIKAATVLNRLREKIIETLSQQGDEITRDGMDMALAVIDKEKMQLNFAGANNPAYIMRSGNLKKIEADRMPIGYSNKLNNVNFSNKTINIKEGDLIYLFSDGFADQFGGKFGKKFNSRRFRELLQHIEKFPMEKQKKVAEAILNKWKGQNEQIDDILLIGIKM